MFKQRIKTFSFPPPKEYKSQNYLHFSCLAITVIKEFNMTIKLPKM